MIGRRDILKGVAATAAMTKVSFALAQDKPKPRTRIVFLGTKGGPRVTTGRSNPASVLPCRRSTVSPRASESVSSISRVKSYPGLASFGRRRRRR